MVASTLPAQPINPTWKEDLVASQPTMWAVVRGVHSRLKRKARIDDGELFADLQLAALRYARNYLPGPMSFSSYLYGRLLRYAVGHCQNRARGYDRETELRKDGMDALAVREWRERQTCEEVGLQRLPEPDRGVMAARLEGQSQQDIADQRGVSQQMVARINQRAEERLLRLRRGEYGWLVGWDVDNMVCVRIWGDFAYLGDKSGHAVGQCIDVDEQVAVVRLRDESRVYREVGNVRPATLANVMG